MSPSRGRVAILRESARAEVLRRLLIERGYEVLVRPVTRTEYLEHPKDGSWAAGVRESGCVIFTSLNAIEALAAGVGGIAALGRLLDGRWVAVIGRASAAALESVGIQPMMHDRSGGSAGLVRGLIDCLPPGTKVLYPSAATVYSPEIGQTLEAAGHLFRQLICYRTLRLLGKDLPPIDWTSLDLAVMAAPSAVDVVREDPTLPRQFPFVAIGPSTATALREHGMNARAVAETPDAESICAAIERVCP